MKDRPYTIFIAAGEASGDALGARLMSAMKAFDGREIEFHGIGGGLMEEQGVTSLFPMDELSVMGLIEILPRIRHLLKRISETADYIRKLEPDAVITIDSPGFAHQLAKKLGGTSFSKIHYVAPSVWAWKPGRVHKFKKHFDHLLALLPIEPPYFEAVGLPCHFVGHSVLESGADKGDGAGFRARQGLDEKAPVLCLLPGSRRGEITRLMPEFSKTIEGLNKIIPDLQVVLPTLPARLSMIREMTAEWEKPPIIVEGAAEKFDAMAASNVALAASGTVALELTLAHVPTVIAYRLSPLTHFIVRRLVKVDYAHLLNILMKREIVPERIQDDCQSAQLIADLRELLGEKGAEQTRALKPALEMLKAPEGNSPSKCAASVVFSILDNHIEKM
ncbi:lipid-A-disaccharide synthase [Aestuariispira insulae]|uniref:Lipid-A-disaccharide synthase n=1 Tax=Aestuariispira insulae TaxID=1461337 RepID=A0A3D9HUX0_9PROT|nr:lipid-A-disaccharide synthase [Aestuariispira insulae]RED53288.1 lipid-A-disaccharide synthase [Aestuariispira insulae]